MTIDSSTVELGTAKLGVLAGGMGTAITFIGMTVALIDGLEGRLVLWEMAATWSAFAFFFVVFIAITWIYYKQIVIHRLGES